MQQNTRQFLNFDYQVQKTMIAVKNMLNKLMMIKMIKTLIPL